MADLSSWGDLVALNGNSSRTAGFPSTMPTGAPGLRGTDPDYAITNPAAAGQAFRPSSAAGDPTIQRQQQGSWLGPNAPVLAARDIREGRSTARGRGAPRSPLGRGNDCHIARFPFASNQLKPKFAAHCGGGLTQRA